MWFGLASFWGHLRHLVASAIAAEDIDSRDWMTPDDPLELNARVIDVLGGSDGTRSLVEAMDRDVWIDFIADTGDDVSVSRAVARLVIERYELPDPDRPGAWLTAPRGDILLFGGDTAYPVATVQEIANRVVVPFNEVLSARDDGKPRVLLGIPGNHDWYDGLDGFRRLFRWRKLGVDDFRPSVVQISRRTLDYYAEWARELVRGGKVEKPKSLVLTGYTPVQNASYFILPLSPGIHLFAIDRQLRDVDRRQLRHYADWQVQHPDVHRWILLPDPLYQFGRPSVTGTAMVRSLALDFEQPTFLLSGDIHHYERSRRDQVLHVIAGGGGAFLHPAPLVEGGTTADARWPDVAQTRVLLGSVPWKVAFGRSGFLPHMAFLLLFAPAMTLGVLFGERYGSLLVTPLVVTACVGAVYALIGGARRRNYGRVLPIALGLAVLTAIIPVVATFALTALTERLGFSVGSWVIAMVTLTVSVFAGAWIFGAYLALLTRLGLEHTQAFTALDHPGFKHFLRLRVRRDGSGVDAWCIGLVDPVADESPVLVDHFSWRPNSDSAE